MRIFVMLLIAVACSSNKGMLSEKAKELEIFATKPNGCHVVGKVVGGSDIGSTEMATNDALNQAASLKASGIFIDQEVPNGKSRSVFATAYDCP